MRGGFSPRPPSLEDRPHAEVKAKLRRYPAPEGAHASVPDVSMLACADATSLWLLTRDVLRSPRSPPPRLMPGGLKGRDGSAAAAALKAACLEATENSKVRAAVERETPRVAR